MNCLSMAFSVALFLTVAVCYNASCPTCYSPSNPYWTMQRLLQEPVFFLLLTVTPGAALLPRYALIFEPLAEIFLIYGTKCVCYRYQMSFMFIPRGSYWFRECC